MAGKNVGKKWWKEPLIYVVAIALALSLFAYGLYLWGSPWQ